MASMTRRYRKIRRQLQGQIKNVALRIGPRRASLPLNVSIHVYRGTAGYSATANTSYANSLGATKTNASYPPNNSGG